MKTPLLRECACACICACAILVNAELTPTGTKTVVLDAAYSARENLIDSNWQFSRDNATWESISVPHDFSIRGPFGGGEAESGHLPGGTGYYKRSFKLAPSTAGKRIIVDFDGVYQHAVVKVNSTAVGENHYGYNNFAFDITSAVHCDGVSENVLEVEVSQVQPTSRWYPGTGIERDVKIFALPAAHLVTDGIYITTPDISNGVNTVHTSVEMKNESASAANLKARVTVYAYGSSEALATSTSSVSAVAAGAMVTASVDVTPASVALWSPENPNRYQAKVELLDADNDDAVVDTQYETFGFRYFSRDPVYGLKLNGSWYKLYGSDLHHDLGAFGAAYNDGLWRKRLLQLKDMGVNALRTGHNPYPKKFMALCDELGFFVLDEFFDGWYISKNNNGRDFSQYFETVRDDGRTWAQFVVDQTVRRDRNCPSVLAWDVGDEVSEGNGDNFKNNPAKAGEVATNLCNWVLANDATRPITYGDNRYNGEPATANIDAALYGAGGWIGLNYPCGGNGWAGPAGAQKGGVDAIRNMYGSFLATESSSSVTSRGRYAYDDFTKPLTGEEAYHITSYDVAMPGWGSSARGGIRYSLMNDFVIGEFIWTGFDYIGEPTPWNGPTDAQPNYPNSSYFGRIDTCGFEKDDYYIYRANWKKDGHTLHLVGGWTSDNQAMVDGKAVVYVYSDAPKYTLYLGGDPIAHAVRVDHESPDTGHTYYTYTVTVDDAEKCVDGTATGSYSDYAQLAPRFLVSMTGTLTVRAFDGEDGEISGTVGRKTLATPNATKHLAVTADEDSVVAGDENIVRFVIDVLDSEDVPVLMGSPLIDFSIEGNGEIVGVDNGDPATDLKFQVGGVLATGGKSASIKAYAGKALVLVKAVGAGRVTLNAASDGIAGGSDYFIATAKSVAPGDGVACSFNCSYSTVRGDPLELPVIAEGGTIEWTSVPSAEDLLVEGSYTCQGMLSAPGCLPVPVSASVTVVPPAAEADDGSVVALRNVALVMPLDGYVEEFLPAQVWGLTAAAHTNGLFTVTWNQSEIDAFDSSEVATNVIHGTASDKSVTATVRTLKGKGGFGDYENLAPLASSASVTSEPAADYFVDIITTAVDYVYVPTDNAWQDRFISKYTSQPTEFSVTTEISWDSPVDISKVELIVDGRNWGFQNPSNVEFYADNSDEPLWATPPSRNDHDSTRYFLYSFGMSQRMSTLTCKFSVPGGLGFSIHRIRPLRACSGIGTVDPESKVRLDSLEVDEAPVEGFIPATLNYEVQGGSAITAAESDSNIGITVLPKFADTKKGYVVTLAEDGESSLTYSVALTDPCLHPSITTNAEVAATCLQDGLTEQWQCDICHKILKHSTVIPATGHLHWTTNATVQATCTVPGHYGSVVCSDCSAILENEVPIPALGHDYVGVIDPYPTYDDTGLETFTCTRCSDQYQVVLPKLLPVVALRNVAAVMTEGGEVTDALPENVVGLTAVGDTTGSFPVTWNTAGLTFTAGNTVLVPGTATVNVGTMDVTGSVRVVSASSGTVNCSEFSTGSILDTTKSNKGSAAKINDVNDPANSIWDADLIFELPNKGQARVKQTWSSGQTISKIRVCYLNNPGNSWCLVPDNVGFFTDDDCQHPIATDGGRCVEVISPTGSNGDYHWYEYAVSNAQPITTLVGRFSHSLKETVLIRFWALSGASSGPSAYSDSVIDAMSVDGVAIADFASATTEYTVTNGTAITSATAVRNTGITVLPLYSGTTNAYVVTVSEDGEHTGKYSVYMPEGCRHLNRIDHEAVPSTCTVHGTGAWQECADCHVHISEPSELPLAPHTEVDNPNQPASDADYEHDGHTQGTWCDVCHTVIYEWEVIPRLVSVSVLRNIAAVTTEATLPVLPAQVWGLGDDGVTNALVDVVWTMPAASQFTTAASPVVVNGSATVNGEPMPVTASVRVAESSSEPDRNLSLEVDKFTLSGTAGKNDAKMKDDSEPPYSYTDNEFLTKCYGMGTSEVKVGWDNPRKVSKVRVCFLQAHNKNGVWCDVPDVIHFYKDYAKATEITGFTSNLVSVEDCTKDYQKDNYYWYDYVFADKPELTELVGTYCMSTNQSRIVRCWIYGTDGAVIENIAQSATSLSLVSVSDESVNVLQNPAEISNITNGIGSGTSWVDPNGYIATWGAKNHNPSLTDIEARFSWSEPRKIKSVICYVHQSYIPDSIVVKDGAGNELGTVASGSAATNPAGYPSVNAYRSMMVELSSSAAVSELKIFFDTTKLTQLAEIIILAEAAGGGTGGGSSTPLATKDLDDLKVDGVTVSGFTSNVYGYSVKGGKAITAATADDNMGITILPKANGAAYVVTVAEDGTSTSTYTVNLPSATGLMFFVR